MATKQAMKVPESLYTWTNEKNIGWVEWENRKRFVKQCEAFEPMASVLRDLLKDLREHFPMITEPVDTAIGLHATYVHAERILKEIGVTD